jgi:hypothetical protein
MFMRSKIRLIVVMVEWQAFVITERDEYLVSVTAGNYF